MDSVVIRVPFEEAGALEHFWRDLRIASGYPATIDLSSPQKVARFDGAALAEYLPHLTSATVAIITGVLGYLVARRGQIEIGSMKFKNVSLEDIDKIFQLLHKYPNAVPAQRGISQRKATKPKATKRSKGDQ